MRKYKLTGCARFLIFLLIATPLAYFAASYYNNQDPFQSIQNWFAGADQHEIVTDQKAPAPTGPDTTNMERSVDTADSKQVDKKTQPPSSDTDALLHLIDKKEARIEELIRQNERLRNELERIKKQE